MKKKLYDQAVSRNLIEPKKESFWKRELKPIFVDNFQFSSSEDEEVQEKARKEARAAVRAKRKEDRQHQKEIAGKLKDVKLGDEDD